MYLTKYVDDIAILTPNNDSDIISRNLQHLINLYQSENKFWISLAPKYLDYVNNIVLKHTSDYNMEYCSVPPLLQLLKCSLHRKQQYNLLMEHAINIHIQCVSL